MKVLTIKKMIRTIVFVIICNSFFLVATNVSLGFDPKLSGFFEEPNNSLDAVYIGASPVYSSWIAPIAWKKYGIAVWGFSNSSQPFISTLEMLKEARKRQPNAIYLIAVNGIYSSDELKVESLHSTTDQLPLSFEKFSLVNRLCNSFQRQSEDWVELLFPLVRYHSKWDSLSKASFHQHDSIKGSRIENDFLTEVEDISEKCIITAGCNPLPRFTEDFLSEIFEYCRAEKVKVIFVLSAQYRDERTVKWYNTIIEEIGTWGFPLINELDDFASIGLDDTKDFSNEYHTNIHDALKITDYLSAYLLAHYDFPEKSIGGGVLRKLGRGLRQI